jgi:penicillin-binding protein 1A
VASFALANADKVGLVVALGGFLGAMLWAQRRVERRERRPRRAAWWTRRSVRVGAGALLAVCALSALGAGLIYGSAPGVGDAPQRAAALERAHGARAVAIRARERVVRAIVAVEDKRFYEHGAIDPLAIGRVVLATLGGRGAEAGGSTIAVQLAKVLYQQHGSLIGELRAIALAFKLEASYSKREILSMYLNTIYFGHGYYGVERASRGYFRRAARALSWGQAALLAGLPQAPSAFDPLRHLASARFREQEVLTQLVATHALSPRAARRIAAEQLHLTA